jgi:hypothetical protein
VPRWATVPKKVPVGVRTTEPTDQQCAAVVMKRWPDGFLTVKPAEQVPPPLVIAAPPQKDGMSSRRCHRSLTGLLSWSSISGCSLTSRSVTEAGASVLRITRPLCRSRWLE